MRDARALRGQIHLQVHVTDDRSLDDAEQADIAATRCQVGFDQTAIAQEIAFIERIGRCTYWHPIHFITKAQVIDDDISIVQVAAVIRICLALVDAVTHIAEHGFCLDAICLDFLIADSCRDIAILAAFFGNCTETVVAFRAIGAFVAAPAAVILVFAYIAALIAAEIHVLFADILTGTCNALNTGRIFILADHAASAAAFSRREIGFTSIRQIFIAIRMRLIACQLASAIFAHTRRNTGNCRTVKSRAFACASAIFRACLRIRAYGSIAHLAHRLIGIRALAFTGLTRKPITANCKALACLGSAAEIRMRLRIDAVAVAVYQRATVFTAHACIAFLVIVTFEFFPATAAVVFIRFRIDACAITQHLIIFADDFAFAVRTDLALFGIARFIARTRCTASLCTVKVYACAIAVFITGRAALHTSAVLTGFTIFCITNFTAFSAVGRIDLDVDACILARDFSGIAVLGAFAIIANQTIIALVTAFIAVIGIRLQIVAAILTDGFGIVSAHKFATRINTFLTATANRVAIAAVIRILRQVSTGLATRFLSLRTCQLPTWLIHAFVLFLVASLLFRTLAVTRLYFTPSGLAFVRRSIADLPIRTRSTAVLLGAARRATVIPTTERKQRSKRKRYSQRTSPSQSRHPYFHFHAP